MYKIAFEPISFRTNRLFLLCEMFEGWRTALERED